jgi:hypothetical protein
LRWSELAMAGCRRQPSGEHLRSPAVEHRIDRTLVSTKHTDRRIGQDPRNKPWNHAVHSHL